MSRVLGRLAPRGPVAVLVALAAAAAVAIVVPGQLREHDIADDLAAVATPAGWKLEASRSGVGDSSDGDRAWAMRIWTVDTDLAAARKSATAFLVSLGCDAPQASRLNPGDLHALCNGRRAIASAYSEGSDGREVKVMVRLADRLA